jgi:subtilisin family serine protease
VTRWVRLAFLTLLLGIVGPLGSVAVAQAAPAAAEDSREILVMIKMPAAHYNPSSGYAGTYGDTALRAANRRKARGIAARHGLKLRDGWPMPLLGIDCYVMVVPAGTQIDQVVLAVSREPGVAWSQRMNEFRVEAAPPKPRADPLFPVQPTAIEWRLRELQRVATGKGAKIAIIDSKVDVQHPDLAGQFVADRNFVDGPAARAETHGTNVAGIIGSKPGNGMGVIGVAPGAKLMALRACREFRGGGSDGKTLCNSIALARALQFAIENGADVINLSLSGPPDMLLGKLVDVALSRRIAVVAAFEKSLPRGGFPAAVRGVIPVADEMAQRIPPGVYGAPGSDLPTTQAGGGWCLVTGSSFAAAQVSGLAALAMERGRRPFSDALVRGGNGRIEPCATVLGPAGRCGRSPS